MKKKKKFYTCKNDRVFKEIFGNELNKDLLKNLLENTLGLKINKIIYSNVEKNVDNIYIKRKTNDMDISTDKAEIQIEVNAKNLPYVHPRNASYLFNKYSNMTKVGKQYSEDTLLIQLNLSYGLSKEMDDLYSLYLVQTLKGKPYIRNLYIYEFNMDKYKKIWYNKTNRKEIIRNKYIIMLNLKLKQLKKLLKITNYDKVVLKYMKELERVNRDPQIYEYMSAEEDNEKIQNSLKRYALESGMKKGIKEGIKEGKKQGIIETAISLLKNKVDIDIIASSTGLSIKELQSLNLNN